MIPLYAGIEAGGTKFVCGTGSGPENCEEIRFPTTTPDETVRKAINYFREKMGERRLRALGIASFGPLDPDPDSPTYGFITSTPKPGWESFDLVGVLQKELKIPCSFDTDVNGAAIGEQRWGAGRSLNNFIYLTIGTGIGGGGIINGKPLHGLMHPEMGHIFLPHDRDTDPFDGICPFHGDCLEGLASGPAIEARWGVSAEDLPIDHIAWNLEADYLSFALMSFICTLSPQRIILGGGVMEHPTLISAIRVNVQERLNNYIKRPQILTDIDRYIVPPALGNKSGILGALAMAEHLFHAQQGDDHS